MLYIHLHSLNQELPCAQFYNNNNNNQYVSTLLVKTGLNQQSFSYIFLVVTMVPGCSHFPLELKIALTLD